MKIAIDKNVPVPAYQQVVDGVSAAVARGDLGRGSRLPSVRNLAVDLGLNVNTVARAYRDLERAGIIDTMPGMGSFVASSPPAVAGSPTPLGGGATVAAPESPGPATSWLELLAAAHALAAAEGLSPDDFLQAASKATREAEERADILLCGTSLREAADIMRCLPRDLAATARPVPLEDLAERLVGAGARVVATSFPSQVRVRDALGVLRDRAVVVPVESELTEETIRQLSELAETSRIALVTVDKDNWDQEANDVMKIVGRGRWLKMVLLESGERGLAERLEQVDAIVHVPQARAPVAPFQQPDRPCIELGRQLTARARERLTETLRAATSA